METISPIIQAGLGLITGAGVFALALALARRSKGPRSSELGLWSPAAVRQSGAKPEAAPRAV